MTIATSRFLQSCHKLFLVTFLAVSLPIHVWAAQDAGDKSFTQAQLDQMMAPIALYPDPLLSQILMASTYPSQVAEAVGWSKANPDEKGDSAVKAVQDKAWDASVASLVAFPQVLAMMGDKPDWVKQVGDAFLADPKKVMSTVQELRTKAKDAGNLKNSEQQTVSTQTSGSQTIIMVEPANPQVVYVPAYNPTIVYGTWWWPAYPPFYWPPPPVYGFAVGFARGIGFGVGIAVTNSLWGGCNWRTGNVNINVSKYNNINVNHKLNVSSNSVSWKHNAINRKGTPYADHANQEKYGQKLNGSENRNDFRGRDVQREQASQAMQKMGIDPATERGKLSGTSGDRIRNEVSGLDRSGMAGPRSDLGGQRSGLSQRSPTGKSGASRDRSGGFDSFDRGQAFDGLGDRDGGRLNSMRGDLSTNSFGGRRGGGNFGGGRVGGGRGGGFRR